LTAPRDFFLTPQWLWIKWMIAIFGQNVLSGERFCPETAILLHEIASRCQIRTHLEKLRGSARGPWV
jgi:hypothetical protein